VQRQLSRRQDGINLIGYFSSTFGVAEVGRFFARQALQVHLPISITNIHSETHQRLSEAELRLYRPLLNRWSNFHKTIFFINASEIISYHKRQAELFTGRYNAAVFFWEFDDYFHFPDAFAVLEEAIAFTDFVAMAIRKAAPAGFKVTKLNFPFVKNWELTQSPQAVRRQHAIADNDFVFIFNFDFRSICERKNPVAILRALEMAFNESDRIILIMKTIHAEFKGQNFVEFETVLNEMTLRNRVIVINESLNRNEMMSLINAADSYISLHRSEGLGLGMMEAMSMGKPVIGTAFGGNLDFMNTDNSLLVNYKLVPLERDLGPYKKGWLWAEADVQMAAGYMRKLYDDRAYAKALGQKAQRDIEANYNSTAFSKELRTWLLDK
jgi:glycosyltransferase involved in cell wall biosynthesis